MFQDFLFPYGVDDHPLLQGTNGGLDSCTYRMLKNGTTHLHPFFSDFGEVPASCHWWVFISCHGKNLSMVIPGTPNNGTPLW